MQKYLETNAAAPPKVRFIVASRETGDRFSQHTSLGKCLCAFPVEIRLFEKNTKGLPCRYNEAINEARTDPAILVFIHDDVFLLGFFFISEIIKALQHFEIVGIVGNKRRVPRQPSWLFLDTTWRADTRENTSGLIGEGHGAETTHFYDFGTPCQEVKLLDGFFLAASSQTLISRDIAFDEQFDFNFYDLDFCRQAEAKKVRMGTWNISANHKSKGFLGTKEWDAAYVKYLDKWKS